MSEDRMETQTDVKFVGELPPDNRGRSATGRWQKVILAVRANPGQWAEARRIPANQPNAANPLYGIRRRMGADDIEIAQRTVGAEIVVFVRSVTS